MAFRPSSGLREVARACRLCSDVKMFARPNYQTGIQIDSIATCDFDGLQKITNDEILKRARGEVNSDKLIRFVTQKMGIESRYFVQPERDALDLAREAVKNLLAKEPDLVDTAEAFIYAGISNPMPTVCHAALLACEFGFKNASCWDVKSGCSTGVLAYMQALDWFQHGTKKAVIVCAESFSKFTQPETLQMAISIGDGACALSVSPTPKWKIRGAVHGTNPSYFKSMYVPGKYPVKAAGFDPNEYVFQFSQAGETIEALATYWQNSLADLLKMSGVRGEEITHYISHQVDGTKNRMVAEGAGIPAASVATNFKTYGNMGCPTIFINYAINIAQKNVQFKTGDKMILHAVGGGLTWAGLCLERV
ncbi:MAG TPA: 3-oxoacyl-[acyl-carrier-protein] synthase III C-terminal domain-containing protein [Bdellovibrionales bacterium]|nr:3-oxoacyl-[acyl-carrier-protein] synthase III C-terminal domain-containing protein [Bdellovibrionales bacterium]